VITLAHRHAASMGMQFDENTEMFYLRNDKYVIGLDRGRDKHHVSMCTVEGVPFEALHDAEYDNLDTAVLVVHGLARRHGVGIRTNDRVTAQLVIDDTTPLDPVAGRVHTVVHMGPVTGTTTVHAAREIAAEARVAVLRELAEWLPHQPLECSVIELIRRRADELDTANTNGDNTDD